ncbi:polysaccharide deacetylase [Saccharibacillus sp. JS10]|uniref:polysaccharide deacetylase n=1 Tax=Saccharibacillus sp. JS10 TaxID=2950552 RepID=UPI002109B7A9|nr:polysaccharide deacetylase family protein [Saccharibacillus sp. JS10]MCQ4086508.1 polysaccharide deacetylase family protein [Saccharibacillus sp. JS10]
MKKLNLQGKGKQIGKKSAAFALTVVLLSAILPQTIHASGVREFSLGYNDELTTIKAQMSDGALYVPLREVSKQLHLQVSGTKDKVVLTGSKHNVVIIPSKQTALSGKKSMPIKTYISAGRLMIPASLLKGTFNFGVAYDGNVSLARITSGKQKLSFSNFVQQSKPALNPAPSQPVTPAKPQNPVHTKPIYLTFDDGPTAHTKELLDILDQYNAKATFFMLGPNINSYPKVVERLVKSGNTAGLHGITHVKSKFYASPASALAEMNQDNEDLYRASGVKTTLIRTPYGSKPYFKDNYRNQVLADGFHLWDWNVDSEDWKYKKDHEKVIQSVLQQIATVEKQGHVPVVLMHDQPATLHVLPEVLKTLSKEGFTFEAIDPSMKPVNFWHDER